MKKSETKENYLEAIYIISLNKTNVRAMDIVNYLGYSRPTVSIALKELEAGDFLKMDGFNVILTDKGKHIAETIYERHELIAALLMYLGVDEKTAYEDSCKIEHDISKTSFEAIKNSIKNHRK